MTVSMAGRSIRLADTRSGAPRQIKGVIRAVVTGSMDVTVQPRCSCTPRRPMYAPAPPPGPRYSPHPAAQKHPYPAQAASPRHPQQHPPPPQRHKGTLHPGQIVDVGQCHVRIERYLSEGGYAHVYLTTSDTPIYPPGRSAEKKGRWGDKGYTQHCLKRIAFQDDSVWVDVKKEIEVMVRVPCIAAAQRRVY